jgi:hypothetical protein
MTSIGSLLAQNQQIVSTYLFPNCTRSVPDMHRYEAGNGDSKPFHEGISVPRDIFSQQYSHEIPNNPKIESAD